MPIFFLFCPHFINALQEFLLHFVVAIAIIVPSSNTCTLDAWCLLPEIEWQQISGTFIWNLQPNNAVIWTIWILTQIQNSSNTVLNILDTVLNASIVGILF